MLRGVNVVDAPGSERLERKGKREDKNTNIQVKSGGSDLLNFARGSS